MSAKPANVGDELVGPVRVITPQRIEWYDSAMLSAATDELRQVGTNIHTDVEFAQQRRLPDRQRRRHDHDELVLGDAAALRSASTICERGELRTKYIKPVNLGVELHVRGRIMEVATQPDGTTRYTIDVWCEDAQHTKLVDGDAKVDVAPR